jgi:hypothetical protein
MLDLSTQNKRMNAFPKPGRSPELFLLTPQQARGQAQALAEKGLPPSLKKSVDFLTVGGAMTAAQLGLSPRTLRRHAHLRVIDRLPHNAPVVVETFLQYGVDNEIVTTDIENYQLFTLGPVGIEYVKMQGGKPMQGYTGYSLDRILHDVIVNEIVLRIAADAMSYGWTPVWVSEREAALYQGDQQILKPDALLRLKRGEEEHLYLIEYHNEDKSTRAAKKVQIYERAHQSRIWQEAWGISQFPPVLAAFRQGVVGHGYVEGLQALERQNCTFYGRLLPSVLQDSGQWANLSTNQRENVFPWGNGQADNHPPDNGQGA